MQLILTFRRSMLKEMPSQIAIVVFTVLLLVFSLVESEGGSPHKYLAINNGIHFRRLTKVPQRLLSTSKTLDFLWGYQKSCASATLDGSSKKGGAVDQKNDSVFDPILSNLKSKTKVSIKLPTYLGNESETSKLYATLQSVSDKHYEIVLGFTEDCDGGNACRWGIVRGERNKPKEFSKGISVQLANKTTGYFIEATCGAVCSDSTLSWSQNGQYYTVGIKAAKVEMLVKVANSAIK